MADFKTHLTVAAILSTPLAASTVILGVASMNDAIIYALAGTLGGLLPDIDADDSAAIRLIFRLFGALVAGLAIAFGVDEGWLFWQTFGLAAVSYLLMRFPIQWVFEQFTIHRGTLHSLLANVMFALLSVAIAYHLFGLTAKTAWGMGGFILFGAMIHLILDELYSIELSGMRIKRSFGTALKITDWGEPLASLLLVLGCALGYWLSPPLDDWLTAFAMLSELSNHS